MFSKTCSLILTVWQYDLKISRGHLLSKGIHCTKICRFQTKGSKDIERVSPIKGCKTICHFFIKGVWDIKSSISSPPSRKETFKESTKTKLLFNWGKSSLLEQVYWFFHLGLAKVCSLMDWRKIFKNIFLIFFLSVSFYSAQIISLRGDHSHMHWRINTATKRKGS